MIAIAPPARHTKPWLPFLIGAVMLWAGVVVFAQIERGDRGIAPINSSNDLLVSGIAVDVTGNSAEDARQKGWQEAQRKGWAALFTQMNGGAGAPQLSDAALNGIVSSIVVEHEMIGPRRYIATLGVEFDRARAGQILGIGGRIFHSPPLLVVPIVYEGGVAQVFETRSEWQRAWAQFRTADSSIDYVRTSGTGIDILLLNAGQTRRRQRTWWRDILDQYGAADVLMPSVRIDRSWPGGPIVAHFAGRFGPDSELLGTFDLTTPSPAGLRALMTEGVKRIDALYVGALADGRLRTDPSLLPPPPLVAPIDPAVAAANEAGDGIPGVAPSAEPGAPATPPVSASSFTVQIETRDADAVTAGESAVRKIAGVESAQISSMAIGGISVMRVRYRGDSAALRTALAADGWRVSESGGGLRISR